MSSDLSEEIEFDPFSSTYFDDPYDVYRQLRDHKPVYRNDRYGFYALSCWDDVVEASRDWHSYTSTHGVDLASLTKSEIPTYDSLITIDPPKHDRMRALVSRVFTPRAIGGLEPMIRDVIGGYFDGVADRDEFDLVQDVSGPFPIEVISRMLGVPEGERQQVRHWLDLILTREEGEVDYGPEAQAVMVEIGAYFFDLARRKRAEPGDDMLSRLTQVEVDDDDGNPTRLTDVEIAGFGTLIGGAGAETVTKLVGNAGVLFDANPDQWQQVSDDPSTVPGEIEEILRYHPPSQYQGRFSTTDVSLHGEVIPAGWPVILLTGSAVRDERQFDDPDRFDITRPPSLSIGFGYGIHSCLGAALARMESRIAIEELASRHPRFEVDHDGLRRVHMANVAGYSHVPVRVRR